MAASRKTRTGPAAKRKPAAAKLAGLDAGWRTFIKAAGGKAPPVATWPDPTGAPSLKKTIRKAVTKKPAKKKAAKKAATGKAPRKPAAKKKRAAKK